MEEIAYDIPSYYPLPPKNVDWGEVSTLHNLYLLRNSFFKQKLEDQKEVIVT